MPFRRLPRQQKSRLRPRRLSDNQFRSQKQAIPMTHDSITPDSSTTPERDPLWDTIVHVTQTLGLGVLLVNHLTKEPDDPRPPSMASEDDRLYRDEQQRAGNPKWSKLRAPRGVHLATRDLDRLRLYVDEYRKRHGGADPNIGVRADPTRVIFADADHWEGVRGLGGMTIMTVRTPGKQDKDGNWVHQNGAHLWMRVDEPLPEGITDVSVQVGGDTAHHAVSVLVQNRYVLMPPSRRREGSYEWVSGMPQGLGSMPPVHEALVAALRVKAEEERERAARAAERIASPGDTPLDDWARDTPWADILIPSGFSATGTYMSCGCENYTAPGEHASDKSATAHDTGCLEEGNSVDTTNGGVLHMWSDGDIGQAVGPRQKRYTKPQIAAWWSGMSIGEWARGQGLIEPPTGLMFTPEVMADRLGDDWREQLRAQITDENRIDWDRPRLTVVPPLAEDAGDDDESGTEATAQPSRDQGKPMTMRERYEAEYGADTGSMNVEPDYAHPSQHPDDVPTTDPAACGAPVPEVVWIKANRAQRRRMANLWMEAVTVKGEKDDEPWEDDPFDPELYPLGHPSEPALIRKIVEGADWTRAMFHHARAGHAQNPIGAVLMELVRTGVACPPDLMVRRGMPLSTIVVFLGRAGSGKGQTMRYGDRPWRDSVLPKIWRAGVTWAPPRVKPMSMGSGEAMGDALTEEVVDDEGNKTRRMKDHPVAMLQETELSAFFQRAGGETASLVQAECAAWAMEPLGTFTKGKGDGVVGVDEFGRADPYSVFFTGGLQPKKSRPYQLAEAVGFPQRCIDSAVSDPCKAVGSPVIPPSAMMVHDLSFEIPKNTYVFTLCDEIADALAIAEVQSSRDTGTEEEDLSSHALAVRIRLACLYALRCGRLDVTFDDWVWTGWVMEHSRRSWAYMKASYERATQGAAEKVAVEEGLLRNISSKAGSLAAVEGARKAMSALSEAGEKGLSRTDLLRAALGRGPKPAAVRAGVPHPHDVLGPDVINVLIQSECTMGKRGRGEVYWAPGMEPRPKVAGTA
ncbi:hypothetical protein ACXYTP_21600 [Tsukamurella ocularis]